MESKLTVEKLCDTCGNIKRMETTLLVYRGTTVIYEGTFYNLFDYLYKLPIMYFMYSPEDDTVFIYVF